jgi:hypothetical protein
LFFTNQNSQRKNHTKIVAFDSELFAFCIKSERPSNKKQACSLVPWASSSLKTPLTSPHHGLQEHM